MRPEFTNIKHHVARQYAHHHHHTHARAPPVPRLRARASRGRARAPPRRAPVRSNSDGVSLPSLECAGGWTVT
eukprot:842490-Pyramimonas_sp.AAC.1